MATILIICAQYCFLLSKQETVEDVPNALLLLYTWVTHGKGKRQKEEKKLQQAWNPQ
jgi:hypothetical protein